MPFKILLLLLSISCSAPEESFLDQDSAAPLDLRILPNRNEELDAMTEPKPELQSDLLELDQEQIELNQSLDSEPQELRSSPDAAPQREWNQPFGLLSLNLHCLKLEGTSFESNRARMEAIAQVVKDREIKVLALQELCVQGEVEALELLQSALEEATSLPWSKAWAFVHIAWEGSPDEAEEGLGFLIQGEIQERWEYLYLNQGVLRRLALGIRLPPELGGFDLYSLHLDYNIPEARRLQALESVGQALLRRRDGQILMVGDLNGQAGSEPHRAFLDMGFEDLSAGLDPQGIDHLLAHRGAALEGSEAALFFRGEGEPLVSDHPGVYLKLSPGAPEPFCLTEIQARYDAGFGRSLSLRGEGDSLSWERGFPMINTGPEGWSLALTEISEGFEYKLLLDDEIWQQGENQQGNACLLNLSSPEF